MTSQSFKCSENHSPTDPTPKKKYVKIKELETKHHSNGFQFCQVKIRKHKESASIHGQLHYPPKR